MANVRVFGYSGIVQIEKRLAKQFTSDGVFMRQEPYNWAQNIPLNGATPVTTVPVADDMSSMVLIEVPDGVAVRYEVNPNGPLASNAKVASTNSPKMVGDNVFQWFRGATISFIDASAV